MSEYVHAVVDKVSAMLEDVDEATSLAELKVLEGLIPEYPEVDVPAVRGSIEERRKVLQNYDVVEELRRLQAQLGQLRTAPLPHVKQKPPAMPNTRKYRLIKTDCFWTSKAQVHVLMEIIKSVCKVGEVVAEQEILDAVELNKELLNTRQDSSRVFLYYKGAGGFLEHGCLVQVY